MAAKVAGESEGKVVRLFSATEVSLVRLSALVAANYQASTVNQRLESYRGYGTGEGTETSVPTGTKLATSERKAA